MAHVLHKEKRKLPRPAHRTTLKATFVSAKNTTGLKSRALVTPDVGAPGAPFTQCPAIGNDTSCGILVQVTNSANLVFADPSQGPYDGADDTLVGVVNTSSENVSALAIAADTPVFGFDGDGICSGFYAPEPAGCPFGSTGYEGPDTAFTDISADTQAGIVKFPTPLVPGQSTYFSLEEALSATSVVAGGPSLAEAGGAPNPAEKQVNCSKGQPVNCATGELWHQFTDFSVPGRGVPLDLARTYLSADAGTDGPFGFGWSDSYGMTLSTDVSGNVTVTQEDGAAVTFAPNGSGGYAAPPRVLATLTPNPDGTLTFTRHGENIAYAFTAAGQLISEIDLNGYRTTLTYTGPLLTAVTDPAGRTLTFTYTGNHVSKVTDPLGHAATYAYDAAGDLTSTTDAAGRTWSFAYDTNHLLTSMTDPRGGVTANTYDASNRVVAQSDPKGAKTTWSYAGDAASAGGGTTVITDPNGNATTDTYTSLEMTSSTSGTGSLAQATTTYAYDPQTLGVTSVSDPNGNVTTNTYDAQGDLLTVTDPLGRTTSYQYNSFGQVTMETTPLGETTTSAYDATGNLVGTTDPLNQTTTYNYADSAHPGDVTSVSNRDGNTTTITYDAQGDVASTTQTPATGVSETAAYTYDADGQLACEAAPTATAAHIACPAPGGTRVAGTTTFAYNPVGELLSTTDATGSTTSRSYDGDGNIVSATDADGNTTAYTYDSDNLPTAVKNANGATQTTTYDADGNRTAQSDGAGNTTSYTFDALSRTTSSTDPLGDTTSYAYDADGNQTALTDPSGRTTTAYDADSEPVAITYSDGSTPKVTYTYTADGQRASMTDGTGTTSYTYDADGQQTASTNGAGASVGYGYSPEGHVITLTYPNGQSVKQTYNGTGQLASVTDWLGHTTAVGYNPDGATSTLAYPNGVTSTTSYNAADQITAITDSRGGSTLASFQYALDKAGQVTNETDTGGTNPAPVTYSYTALNQLVSVNGQAYSYDKAGNLTGLPGGTTQSFNAGGQLQTATTPATTGPATAPVLDQLVNSAEEKYAGPLTSPPVTTTSRNELVLAFVSADGDSKDAQQVTTVTGGGLTWKPAAHANGGTDEGTAEVWQAYTAAPLKAAVITATLKDNRRDGAITIATFTGAATTVAATATGASTTTAPSVPLTTTQPDSTVWAVGTDWSNAATETPVTGQTIVSQNTDPQVNADYWAQRTTAPVPSAGTKVTIADTAQAKNRWEMAAVEIPPAIATTSTITTTYQYDKQGNRTGATRTGNPATTLTYDQANRLTAVNGTATYAYNGDGLRTAKTIGTTTTPFTWDLAVPTPLLLSDGTTSYIYGPGGQPIEQITGNTPTYLQTDQQASTRLITDATGTITGAYSYNPYGQTTAHTGTATTALQYNGQYTDTETGYLYLRARYYDPATGQFLTRDPLTTLSGSPYAYADGNPLNASDPTGQFAQILLGGLIGGVAGAVIGGANYFVNNIFIEGKTFSWRGFAASTIGGAVNGGITGACDAALVGVAAAGCSAVGGAAGELTSELIGGEQLNIGKIGFSVVTNGVADAFVPKIGQIGFIPYKISNVFTPGVNATRQYINSFASGGFSTLATDLFNDLLDSAGSPCR